MKNLLFNNPIVDIWKDARSPLEYLIAFWISGLFALAVTSWFYLVVRFILNPDMFNHVTWGLIDYI